MSYILEQGNGVLKNYGFETYDVLHKITHEGDKNKMTTIREQAKAYEPKTTKNIADLDKVSTELDVQTRIVHEGEEDEFTINFFEVNGEEYRIPDSVLKQLKVMMEEKPSMVSFKVKKSGEGMKTSYTVIPLN